MTGFTIDDGRGTGQSAGISPTGLRLDTSSRSNRRRFYISRDNGDAYTWSNATYNAAANDTILLVKNTSTTQNLYITRISMSTDVDTIATIHCPVASFTNAGTLVTGRNENRKSGNTASADARGNETGNTQGDVIWNGEIMATSNPFIWEFDDSLQLGQSDSIGIDYVEDTGVCHVVIVGFFDIE